MADHNGTDLAVLVDSLNIESEALVPASLVLAANDTLATLRSTLATLADLLDLAEPQIEEDDAADLVANVRDHLDRLSLRPAVQPAVWVELDEIECATCRCLFTPAEYEQHTTNRPSWCTAEVAR